jgi:hypothetical protein
MRMLSKEQISEDKPEIIQINFNTGRKKRALVPVGKGL